MSSSICRIFLIFAVSASICCAKTKSSVGVTESATGTLKLCSKRFCSSAHKSINWLSTSLIELILQFQSFWFLNKNSFGRQRALAIFDRVIGFSQTLGDVKARQRAIQNQRYEHVAYAVYSAVVVALDCGVG